MKKFLKPALCLGLLALTLEGARAQESDPGDDFEEELSYSDELAGLILSRIEEQCGFCEDEDELPLSGNAAHRHNLCIQRQLSKLNTLRPASRYFGEKFSALRLAVHEGADLLICEEDTDEDENEEDNERGDNRRPGPGGDPGATGPTGETGDRGPRGPSGDKGFTGPRGPTNGTGDRPIDGPRGPSGPSGPPGPSGPDGRPPGPGEGVFRSR